MILGAGPYQVPAIARAVRSGHHVITVDYLPDNVGHRLSHAYVNCSTVDRTGVLEAAQRLDVDAIATFCSDVAVPTVAFVSEQLGLPGPSVDAAETLSNKGRFRACQRRHGLACPGFAVGSRYEAVLTALRRLRPPLVFKPVDSSGSRGVSRAAGGDDPSCATAFQIAAQCSRTGTACVEEFVSGTEVGGDGFLASGRLAFLQITRKHLRGFVPVGHELPPHVSAADGRRIADELERNCAAAGYTDGPLNFDIIVSPDRIVVLEIGARTGGNGIPALIERATGVDLIGATLGYSLGQPLDISPLRRPLAPCGSLVLGHDRGGILAHVATWESLREAVPEVFEWVMDYSVGDVIPAFVHSGNRIGHALFDCAGPESYHTIAQRVISSIGLAVCCDP